MTGRRAVAPAAAAIAVAIATGLTGCATTEDAQEVYFGKLIEPDLLFVQYADSSSADLDRVDVKELPGRRLAVRVRVRFPRTGQNDDLQLACVYVRLDDAAPRGTTVVGRDGARLQKFPFGRERALNQGCQRRDAG